MHNAPPLNSAATAVRYRTLRVIPWATWLHRVFVVLMYAFMLSPIVLVVWLSFFKDAILYFPPSGYTLSWYVKAWENPAFANGFIFSLQVSLVAAAIGVALGVLAAVGIARYRFSGSKSINDNKPMVSKGET